MFGLPPSILLLQLRRRPLLLSFKLANKQWFLRLSQSGRNQLDVIIQIRTEE